MGDTKHDLMVKTCDPTSLACQCDFTTEDGCEAETGECSCTVWDLIEDNAELEQQLAAANARSDALVLDNENVKKLLYQKVEEAKAANARIADARPVWNEIKKRQCCDKATVEWLNKVAPPETDDVILKHVRMGWLRIFKLDELLGGGQGGE